MDNQKHPESAGDERWLDDVLKPQNGGAEIDIDEDAVIFAGLQSPDESELDQLLSEIRANNWIDDTIVQPALAEPVRETAEVPVSDATMVVSGIAETPAPESAAEPVSAPAISKMQRLHSVNSASLLK